jgi:hypothetical protein
MTDLATEAAAELDVWLNSFARVGQEGSTAVRVALRMALRTLADPAKGGRNPALAAAMLAELERRFPAEYVTVAQPRHNVVWHLTDADGQPVEAGQYVAADGDEFLIVRNPEMVYDNRDMPARVRIRWTLVGNVLPVGIGVDYRYLRELVPGWAWTPEYGTYRAAVAAELANWAALPSSSTLSTETAEEIKAAAALNVKPQIERDTWIQVTKGRYAGQSFAVDQVRADGAVAIIPGWRRLWIKPGAFKVASA